MTGDDAALDVMVIAYDGTDNARRAVHYAGRFLTAAARAVVLTVWSPALRGPQRHEVDLDGPPDPSDTDDVDMALADAQRTNGEGVDLARAAGLPAEALCVPITGTVWGTIIDAADAVAADLIVTGTRGTTGVRSLLQSSVADNVLRHGRRPVLIVPPGP